METINSDITATSNDLTKKIEDAKSSIVAEAVGTTQEIATAVANKQVTSFATSHLKDYVSKFFMALLTDNDVAFAEDVDIVQDRLAKA